jgi:primosomal protein N'
MTVAEVLLLTGGRLAYQTLTYAVPDSFPSAPQPGAGVLVPLQNRLALGLVLRVDTLDDPHALGYPLKPIESVLAQPLLDESLFRLMRLMARTLLCSPAEAVQVVLPTAVRYRLRAVIELVTPLPPLRSPAQRMTAEAIQRHGGRVSLTTLKRELAAAIWQPGLRGLREKGCVRTVYDLAPPSPPPRAEPWVELSASPEALEAFFQADALRAPAQARLLMHLLEHPDGRLPRRALLEATGASLQTLRMLESRGLTRQTHAAAESLPLLPRRRRRSRPPSNMP